MEYPARHKNRNSRQDKLGRGKVKNLHKEGGKVIRGKFEEGKLKFIKDNPIRPRNELQKQYLFNLRNKPYNIAVGFAGTSKTYLAVRVAMEKLISGEIDTIYIVRPAISKSKSLGFFSGDPIEKSKNWIAPVLDTLEEFLGISQVEYLLKVGKIKPIPLETIKGRSLKKGFAIFDESEDLGVDEAISCVTRKGEDCTFVFAGDIMQKDIRDKSGLEVLLELSENSRLERTWGVIDFDRPSDIVRSPEVKDVILALRDMGLM